MSIMIIRSRKVTKLKLAILNSGLTQREVVRRSRLDEGLISLIANGRYIPDAVQRARIAEALRKPESDLFIQ
jgi:transcriptional regulator with XRE-family HTH domain